MACRIQEQLSLNNISIPLSTPKSSSRKDTARESGASGKDKKSESEGKLNKEDQEIYLLHARGTAQPERDS
jgi:hypothetical protein